MEALLLLILLEPERRRSKIQRQGIGGPTPSFLYGNIPQMKKIQSGAAKASREDHHISHNWASSVFPYNEQTNTYVFMINWKHTDIVCNPHLGGEGDKHVDFIGFGETFVSTRGAWAFVWPGHSSLDWANMGPQKENHSS
ncbi:hypothetical protein HHK36_028392 [Tetracentron sinense]|uniref:Uncharacterized protein n=1 Tax=Tetracentron sinense TaxID=13715 RepID=A0A834YB96_TETSI|nr:hypothetical protein HHK36_028392 [Tetracentron sinense]